MSDSVPFNTASFAEMRHDPDVAIQWRPKELAQLAQRVRDCRKCPGLNLTEPPPPFLAQSTNSAPGYGDPLSPVVIVGQSLCGAPCINAQIPFTGGAGKLLDEAFLRADITKSQIFITNVVHCHPQNNRPSLPHEITNCADYLADELRILHPRVIIGLGRDAREWLEGWVGRDDDDWRVTKHAPDATVPHRRALHLAPHPSEVMKQPKPIREGDIETLAASLRWAFEGAQRATVQHSAD